uniref:Glutathione transferase n=1 Tax=Toxocara canis TaxID=6265 RepID=A0A183UX38_TOXCA
LYYFTGRGRGEHIRHILRVAGVPFDDVILTPESWPQYKDDMPLGQVPVLEVDGIKIAQSVAIARFLGHKFRNAFLELDGRNEVENAQLDMIADLISDALNADGIKQWPYVLLGVIKEDKVEYFKERVEPALTAFAPLIEKFLANNNKYGVLIGDKETWVDIFVAEFFSKFIDFGREDCLNAYPHILAHIRRIHSLPPIRDHIRNRLPTLA